MSVPESLVIGLFTLGVVFFVLASLFLLIRLFSFALARLNLAKTRPVPTQGPLEVGTVPASPALAETLQLKNVDEPTAALIMAIVSDELEIPLEELWFKSIRAIEEGNEE